MTQTERVDLGKQHPAPYRALITMSDAAEAAARVAGLEPTLVELVKLRTSQLNRCAFCLRLHTREVIAAGETVERLAVLKAWRESGLYTATERAALDLAESVTLVADRGHDSVVSDAVRAELTDDQVAAVAWLATVMNAFNRVAVTSAYPVEPDL